MQYSKDKGTFFSKLTTAKQIVKHGAIRASLVFRLYGDKREYPIYPDQIETRDMQKETKRRLSAWIYGG